MTSPGPTVPRPGPATRPARGTTPAARRAPKTSTRKATTMRPPNRPHPPTPIYNRRRIGFLNWQWNVTDGLGGPFMVTTRRAWTKGSAWRNYQKALDKLRKQGLA